MLTHLDAGRPPWIHLIHLYKSIWARISICLKPAGIPQFVMAILGSLDTSIAVWNQHKQPQSIFDTTSIIIMIYHIYRIIELHICLLFHINNSATFVDGFFGGLLEQITFACDVWGEYVPTYLTLLGPTRRLVCRKIHFPLSLKPWLS